MTPAVQTAPVAGALARGVSAALFLLLVAGALVTSTGSGLAVPDWPLSFGRYFPPMVGGVLFEHGHRMLAGLVGLATLSLCAWTLAREGRPWVRGLAAAAGGGIVLQALLGGATVLLSLPHAVSIAHACLGQTVFCLVVALAETSSQAEGAPSFWRPGLAAFSAAYAQLFLGALLRHSGAGLWAHLLGAAAMTVLGGLAVARVFSGGGAARQAAPALLMAVLIPLQLALGLAAYAARARVLPWVSFWAVALPTSHLACGALILASSLVLALRPPRGQAS